MSTELRRGDVEGTGQVTPLGKAREGLSRLRPFIMRRRRLSLVVSLAILWIILGLLTQKFFTARNLENLLLESSEIGILAIGTTAVLITEEIDLSIGSIEGLAAVTVGILVVQDGVPWPLGICAAICLGAAIGVVNGVFTTLIRVPSFIVTLATNGLCAGVALVITSGQTIYNFPTAFQQIGQFRLGNVALPVYIAAGVLIVLWMILGQTTLGLNIYSVGGNANAARLVGISPARVKTIVFVISGAAAGLVGVIASARLNSASATYGSSDLLNAIAAVIIGGTSLTGGVGSVIGTAVGVIFVSTVTNGLDLLNVSPFWQQVAVGAVILIMGVSAVRSRASR